MPILEFSRYNENTLLLSLSLFSFSSPFSFPSSKGSMNIQQRRESATLREITPACREKREKAPESPRFHSLESARRGGARAPLVTLASQHSKPEVPPRRTASIRGSLTVGGVVQKSASSMRSEFVQESLVPETYTTAGAKFSARPLSSFPTTSHPATPLLSRSRPPHLTFNNPVARPSS